MQKARLNIQLFGSGIIDGSSTASNCDCRIVWNSTKIDSDNSSLVKMTTQIKKSGSSSTTGTFSGDNIIDGIEFSVSKKTTWVWGDWRTVATSSKTVKHNDNGTKQISISTLLTQTGTSMAGTYRASGTITLDTINRASKLQSISNFDLNDTIIIGIDKYVISAVDTLQIKIGDTLIREVTNIANGYELTFSDTEKTTINSLATNPQVSLIFLLTTVNGGTTLGTSTQSVLVTLLDKPMFREIYQKENGKYQVAINGFVNTEINDVLQVYDDNGNLLNGKTIYENNEGSNGNITLNDSVTGKSCIDIFYKDNDQTYSSVRVYNPDNKHVDISTISRWGNALYIKQKRITISGNKITNGNTAEASFTTAPKIAINTTANNIYITRVVAY